MAKKHEVPKTSGRKPWYWHSCVLNTGRILDLELRTMEEALELANTKLNENEYVKEIYKLNTEGMSWFREECVYTKE